MTFFIMDPNLTATGGHHRDWDLAIAAVARRRGEIVVIFAHKDCAASDRDGVAIVPWFEHTCYERRSVRKYTALFDDFRYFNDRLADELHALGHGRFTALDCVLVPTTTEFHLLGYVAWIKTFEPSTAPLFVVDLMFPSGLVVAVDAEPQVADERQVMLYGLAFQKAAEPGPAVHFFGGGRQIAKEYSELSGLRIEPHPIPFRPVKSGASAGRDKRPKVLVHAGDAKAEKGFLLVPEIVDRLANEHPDWDILVHADDKVAWDPEVRQAFNRLTALARGRDNIVCKTGRLSRDAYEALMAQADCMVSTYDPVVYARKSSGVLWEAISLGLPILAPADTWISREAELWGAGVVTYSPQGVDAIRDGFRRLASRLDELAQKSLTAARAYQEANGPEMLFNQFARLWSARWMAARLAAQPAPRRLPLDEQRGAGLSWHEKLNGALVRWTGLEFDIHFEWSFASDWELRLRAPRFIGPEQIVLAKAKSASGQPLSTRGSVENGAGVIVITGPGSRRGKTIEKVRVALPWTHRVEGEGRDLGILLEEIWIGPLGDPGNAEPAGPGAVTLLSPLGPEGMAILGGEASLSGVAPLDPFDDADFAMSLRSPGGIRAARPTRLFVNGAPIPLKFVASGRNLCFATGVVSRNVIARGGYASDWDLENGEAAAADLIVQDLSFRQGEVTLTCPEIEASNARVERTVAKLDAEELAELASVEVSVDDVFPGGGPYRHIIFEIRNLADDGHSWDWVKFGLLHYRGETWLEFRKLPDWPEFLDSWPGAESDSFGPCFRFPGTPLERIAGARDEALFSALFRGLAFFIHQAADRIGMARDERAAWIAEATALAAVYARAQSPEAEQAGAGKVSVGTRAKNVAPG